MSATVPLLALAFVTGCLQAGSVSRAHGTVHSEDARLREHVKELPMKLKLADDVACAYGTAMVVEDEEIRRRCVLPLQRAMPEFRLGLYRDDGADCCSDAAEITVKASLYHCAEQWLGAPHAHDGRCRRIPLSGRTETGNSGGRNAKSEIVFDLLQMDMFEYGRGYVLHFETFYQGSVLTYTTPRFDVVPTTIAILQPTKTQSSLSANIFQSSAANSSVVVGSLNQTCMHECLDPNCTSADVLAPLNASCDHQCIDRCLNMSLERISCYEQCAPELLSACAIECAATKHEGPGKTAHESQTVFEERVGATLPEIRVALTTFHFARALLGQQFEYRDFSGSYSFAIADGLYTLDALNAQLAAGFESNGSPPDVLSFSVLQDRVQAKIKYEGFNFALARTQLGAMLGFENDLPATQDLSMPGVSFFTATYTRHLLTHPASYANESVAYQMPQAVHAMSVTARVLDRGGTDVTPILHGVTTKQAVAGFASLVNLTLHAAGSFQVVMVS